MPRISRSSGQSCQAPPTRRSHSYVRHVQWPLPPHDRNYETSPRYIMASPSSRLILFCDQPAGAVLLGCLLRCEPSKTGWKPDWGTSCSKLSGHRIHLCSRRRAEIVQFYRPQNHSFVRSTMPGPQSKLRHCHLPPPLGDRR